MRFGKLRALKRWCIFMDTGTRFQMQHPRPIFFPRTPSSLELLFFSAGHRTVPRQDTQAMRRRPELAANSFIRLAHLLTGIPNLERIHILAHSMGSRVAADAIDRLSVEQVKWPLHHLILAAPDIYQTIYEQVAPAFTENSHRVTLYASEHDSSLACSKLFHENPRAGQAGANLMVVAGVDTIDATNVIEKPGFFRNGRAAAHTLTSLKAL